MSVRAPVGDTSRYSPADRVAQLPSAVSVRAPVGDTSRYSPADRVALLPTAPVSTTAPTERRHSSGCGGGTGPDV